MMLRNIMDGKYEFVSPEWDIISDSAKDLVSYIYTLSPHIYIARYRYTCGENDTCTGTTFLVDHVLSRL